MRQWVKCNRILPLEMLGQLWKPSDGTAQRVPHGAWDSTGSAAMKKYQSFLFGREQSDLPWVEENFPSSLSLEQVLQSAGSRMKAVCLLQLIQAAIAVTDVSPPINKEMVFSQAL